MAPFAQSRLIMAVLAIWSSSKAKLSTVDYLEADRLDRIAAQVSYGSYFARVLTSVCMGCTEHCQLNCGLH